ncbi:ABC transporter ATP-binding protein [Pacificibacter marinus]|uniref:ABC transporter ATP-binding protein n=1 Tax=Pacificibacter marinus TaxID=658057 RepID=UPI001C078F5D|nr:ABC transporter ATP-binding protein [Pacificibacter marinus]MBU2867429.1 ABC transporter ATP-binding protein [Pacificibacter marinus]
MSEILECVGVGKRFGGVHALSDVNFTVTPGEIVGIGGPNGAGKTTLLEVITGLTPGSSGRVEFAGTDITGRTPEQVFCLGLARVFQSAAVFPSLTVFENVLAGVVYKGASKPRTPLTYRESDLEATRAAIDLVGLSDKADEVVEHLPILDRKLVTIASAICGKPKMLLLDEPVGGLTPPEIELLKEVLFKLKAHGITMLIIEHVMQFMSAMVDRVMILDAGRIIFNGAFNDMIRDVEVMRVYLGEQAAARLRESFAG